MNSPILNEFVRVIEGINDGELYPDDMHFAYSGSDGFFTDDSLRRFKYAVERMQETLDLAYETRRLV